MTVAICQKKTKLSFDNSTTISSILFELVHADLWGPYQHKTHGNCSYFLTLVEDKSRHTWNFLLPDKTQVTTTLHEFIAYVRTQFDVLIKKFRMDHGTEFVNCKLNHLFASLSIVHQKSC